MANRRALITGITGQDGSDLSELLLEKGWPLDKLKHVLHGLFIEDKKSVVS